MIHIITFFIICDLLASYEIDFDWGEKDRSKAITAWLKYEKLPVADKHIIGDQMISLIKDELKDLIIAILDDSIEREVSKITVELHSNLGEVKFFDFDNIDDAIYFLNNKQLGHLFITSDSITLFDGPPDSQEETD